MPAYYFPRSHGAVLGDGRQRMVLPAVRNDGCRNPHAIVGDDVILNLPRITGHPVHQVGVRRCILRARVCLSIDSLHGVFDLRFRPRDGWAAQSEAMAQVIQAAENGRPGDLAAARDRLARWAGFASWADLYAFNAHKERRGRPDAEGRIVRELIGWSVPA